MHTNGRGPADKVRSRQEQEYELRYWVEALGWSEPRLREAIDMASRSTQRIRERLSRSKESKQAQ